VPGESVATFGDALRRLTDSATHLYIDGHRYWYADNYTKAYAHTEARTDAKASSLTSAEAIGVLFR